jgi:hypothetical protein
MRSLFHSSRCSHCPTARRACRTPTAHAAERADAIIKKHVAALGGEKLLRNGTSFSFKVSGEKMGKKFTKTVYQAKPNKLRVDIVSDEGNFSKGFDGKVAWMKKGADKAVAMTAEETKMMAAHAELEEPLLDYAKKGTREAVGGRSQSAVALRPRGHAQGRRRAPLTRPASCWSKDGRRTRTAGRADDGRVRRLQKISRWSTTR